MNCAIGRVLRISDEPIRTRSGHYSRHSELWAEILAPEPIARRVRVNARRCATQAAEALSAAAMASEPVDGPGFPALIAACLQRTKAARYVGAVTLWVDNECAL